MTRNMNLRSIAVKIVTSAMVTVLIATSGIAVPTYSIGNFRGITVEAASDKLMAE